jgi:ERF superfamily
MTESLTKLPAALAKFQAQHHAAGRDGKGNYGTYTTLAGALAAIQPACAHGLSHTQIIQPISDELMVLRTILMHESGESITSDLPLPIRQEGGRGNAMQALGSTLTYARRYGLLAAYGIAGDDDDGESAAPAKPPLQQTKPQGKPPVKTSPTPAQAVEKPAKAEASPSKEQVEPPLTKDDRDEIMAVLGNLKTTNKTAFAQFEAEFRSAFNLPADSKISPVIQEKKHGDFIQQFLATLPPS